MITVKRKDVTLSEHAEVTTTFTIGSTVTGGYWEATFDGRLSSGERATAYRIGATPQEAEAELEALINRVGWVFEE